MGVSCRPRRRNARQARSLISHLSTIHRTLLVALTPPSLDVLPSSPSELPVMLALSTIPFFASSSTRLSRKVAAEPFDDNDTSADVILRTSDQVDFFVHRVILSIASPVFKDMLAAPQPPESMTEKRTSRAGGTQPILEVAEDSRTMDYILRCSYPVCTPPLAGLTNIRPILYAAYQFRMKAVLGVVNTALQQCLDEDLLGVFALARRCEQWDTCLMAAKETLKHPLTSLYSAQLDQISALQYRRLVEYHQQYSAARLAAAESEESYFWDTVTDPESSSDFQKLVKPSTKIQPRDAYPPFNKSDADLILRSSDMVDFRVHKAILSIASSDLETKFKLPRPTTTSNTPAGKAGSKSLPLVQVSEDARTLESMLRCCYPLRSMKLEQLGDVQLILEAGRKYDIDVVMEVGEAALLECMDQDVLTTFASACRYNFPAVCNEAAKRSLQYPLPSLTSTELAHIPAQQYHRLLQYHQACIAAASTISHAASPFSGTILVPASSRAHCCKQKLQIHPSGQWFAPSQLWQYLQRAEEAIKIRPHRSAVLSEAVWPEPIFVCSTCKRTISRDTFVEALANEIDCVVGKVAVPSFF